MNINKRRASALAGVLALALVAAACGGDNSDSSSSATTTASTSATTAVAATTAAGASTTAGGATTTGSSTASTADLSKLSGTLNGSGATFPQSYYEAAIDAFRGEAPGVTINYGAGGSGKGRQDFADQVTDWGASDAPVKAEDVSKNKGGAFLYFPTVLAPITVSYNLDGVDSLKLSSEVVAKIFQREITDWSDPAIAADNPGVQLSGPITVAHRSDGSGTTENFTRYLDTALGKSATPPQDAWKLGFGSTVQWPADTQAGNGNSGVAQIVKDTKGAIGYVDLSDAKATGLKFAAIKNKAGKFVEPTLEATSAAADGAKVADDLTFFAGWADGETAYPIAAQTWILAYVKQTDKAKGEALRAFLEYMYSDAGRDLAGEVDYAPLGESLQEKAEAQLSKLQIP